MYITMATSPNTRGPFFPTGAPIGRSPCYPDCLSIARNNDTLWPIKKTLEQSRGYYREYQWKYTPADYDLSGAVRRPERRTGLLAGSGGPASDLQPLRSEERRVGKE